ncbi:MAG: CRTAC1 family protein [Planctomycetes bacterium]|nr:CRTAC1 family protein [Planctomycetota bacterium]
MSESRAQNKKTNLLRNLRIARYAIMLLTFLCSTSITSSAGAGIILSDVTRQTGIKFKHTDGSSGKLYLVETVTAGLALFDYDNDGDVDIYFLNGSPLKGTRFRKKPTNALYRNDGGWKFTDVTRQAGVGDTGYGLGVAVADYDNDGDQDIYLNNHGPNVLYRNNGDGTFSDVTKQAGVGNGSQMAGGACFLDMDKDGDLDLYVSNYVVFSYDTHVTMRMDGFKTYVGPKSYPATTDNIYRNNGDGTFTDVSKESGMSEHTGAGMGTVCSDFDNDGDTDIFVANDISAGNFLFENDGTGKFQEIALMAGVAYDLHGDEQGSMGVDAGDYDNDGLLDLYVTSYQGQSATLYRNLGNNMFEDVSRTTSAGAGTVSSVTWGTGFVDFDNDGDHDIFVACGHLLDNIELFDDRSTYLQTNVLLMNDGNGKFTDVSQMSGDGMKVRLSSRSAGFDDLDNDGDVDVVILNPRRGPTVLRNDSESKGHWLQLRLRGVKTNKGGVGARVKVVAGDLILIDEVHSGRGYQSHFGDRLHFGLGKRERVDRVEVQWIGGGLDVLTNVPIDKFLTITEGTGTAQ